MPIRNREGTPQEGVGKSVMFVCDINNQKEWGQSYEGAEFRYVSTVDFFVYY